MEHIHIDNCERAKILVRKRAANKRVRITNINTLHLKIGLVGFKNKVKITNEIDSPCLESIFWLALQYLMLYAPLMAKDTMGMENR